MEGGGGGEIAGVLAGPSLTCLDEVLESLTHVQGDVRVTGEDWEREGEQVSWRGQVSPVLMKFSKA